MLNKSVDAAVASGDVGTATKAIDELDARFVLNVLPLCVKTLNALRQHVSSAPLAGDRQLALGLVDETVAAARADLTLQLLETAVGSARKSGDADLIRRATLWAVKFQQGANVAVKAGR